MLNAGQKTASLDGLEDKPQAEGIVLSLLDDFIGALRLEAKLQDPRRVLVQAITSSLNAPFCVAAAPVAAVPDSKRGMSRSWTVQNPGKIDLGRDRANVRTQKKQRRPTQQIHVRTPSGRTITLRVKLNDTIEQVKRKIQGRVGLLPDQQRLVLAGRLLEDRHTVSHYYRTLAQSTILLTRCLVGGVPIFVEIQAGTQVPMEVGLGDSIGTVKRRINRAMGVGRHQQRLYIAGEPEQLDDKRTVADYGIQKGVSSCDSRLHGQEEGEEEGGGGEREQQEHQTQDRVALVLKITVTCRSLSRTSLLARPSPLMWSPATPSTW